MPISERLKGVLRHYKLNTVSGSQVLGVSQSFVSKILREHKEPSARIYEAIADNFPDVNLHWFITGNGTMLTTGNNRHIMVHECSTYGHAHEERPVYGRRFLVLPGLSGESHAAFVVSGAVVRLPDASGEVLLVCREVPATAAVPGDLMVITTATGYHAGRFFWDTSGGIIVSDASGERITAPRKEVTGYFVPVKLVSDYVP